MENLAESNRIKRRKLGAGAPRLVNEETEQFVAKAIEEKASYHGRRHEPTMYTNRRIKVRDLKNIANYHLAKEGKPPIRSAITVWNRSKPRNLRSMQAKRHIGQSLFCTSKPPKAEDQSNESVHHQRAHVKNVQHFLSSEESTNYSILHSMDDKASVIPGTSTGFEKSRRVKILNLCNEGAKQLPKYDWPEQMVIQTPSAHRIMSKRTEEVDGERRLIIQNDQHFVIVRPKAYVDSSGHTWYSEIIRLKVENPMTFLVADHETHFSTSQLSYILGVQFAVFQYKDMTTSTDTEKLSTSSSTDTPYRKYEADRIEKLCKFLRKVNNYLQKDNR